MECKKEETVISASGTPGYMAPEAIINKPHNFSVDYFALGVILYELTMGERPYQGKDRKEIKEKMFNVEINVDKKDIPSDWDINVAELINGLIKRLGLMMFNGKKLKMVNLFLLLKLEKEIILIKNMLKNKMMIQFVKEINNYM